MLKRRQFTKLTPILEQSCVVETGVADVTAASKKMSLRAKVSPDCGSMWSMFTCTDLSYTSLPLHLVEKVPK